ncbi:MAG: ABC transporter ATP-binding protein [Chloroflexota bacterium]
MTTSATSPSPAASGRASVQVQSLSKTFETRGRRVDVFQDLSFDVPDRSFVGVVGPSGCGKSTLLLCLAGLTTPSSGAIIAGDTPVTAPDPQRIGVVFQDPNLLPWLTVEDNVAFPLELKGLGKKVRREKASQFIQLVGLTDFSHAYPHELSGGMRQRVSIARGLVQDPRILLMDEPFAALDEQTRMKMGAEVLRIWEQTHKTVIFVTHNLTEAVFLCDEVVVLSSRPATILERLTIDLPRPRTYDVMATEHFGRLRDHIWRMIRDLGTDQEG